MTDGLFILDVLCKLKKLLINSNHLKIFFLYKRVNILDQQSSHRGLNIGMTPHILFNDVTNGMYLKFKFLTLPNFVITLYYLFIYLLSNFLFEWIIHIHLNIEVEDHVSK